MTRLPERVTLCPECGRDGVGVQPDWFNRGPRSVAAKTMYRIARHRVRAQTGAAVCVGSRTIVPAEAVVQRVDLAL